ncbi:MAG: HAD family hydrolase [Actinobacteria bacterium]|nr:HAD family hydrolase [Actinomycetota bacterium]
MLKAVTFDYWNTLFVDVHGRERERRRAKILRAELAALGRDVMDTALDDSLRAGFDFFDRVWVAEHRTPSCGELVDSTLAALGARVPEAAHERLVRRFERLLLDLPPEPMPGAVYALPVLAERYRLAVVCDTGYSPGSVLREVLERNGMLAHFEYLYFSNEHGMSKPDVRVFQRTLAALDVRAPEAAHVGDIQRTDIAGAQATGMAAVHFIGANNYDAEHSTADLMVRHFDELPSALGGLTCAGC